MSNLKLNQPTEQRVLPNAIGLSDEPEKFTGLRTRVVTALVLVAALIVLQFGGQRFEAVQWCYLAAWALVIFFTLFEVFLLMRRPLNFDALNLNIAADSNGGAIESTAAAGSNRPIIALGGLLITLSPALVVLVWMLEHGQPLGEALGANAIVTVTGGGVLLALILMQAVLVILPNPSLEARLSFLGEVLPCLSVVGAGGALLLALPFMVNGLYWFWWLLGVVAFNDIAAYFVGKWWGGPKLSPILSPKKTVAGGVGGVGAGLIWGTLFGLFYTASVGELVVLSLSVAIVSQSADLTKSFVKRIHAAKDSGSILPGHGGLLDRIDGLLGGTLVLFLYLVFYRS